MWYFSWVVGLGLACSISILNAIWFEFREDELVKVPVDLKDRVGL